MRLSIIVPFYNVELYIEQCIRSLYAQDMALDDYEVIAVDDCSPDGSRKVVERLQKEYPNLRLLVLPENHKLGGTRNAGFDVAKGDYVMFVDSDDYLLPCVLATLLEQIEKEDLDFLEFGDVRDCNGKIQQNKTIKDTAIASGPDLFFDKGFIWWRDHIVAWNKLYKRDFLLRNKIRFAQNVMYEDNDYAFLCFAYANRVRYVQWQTYAYRNNPASFMRRKIDEEKIIQKFKLCARMDEIKKECSDSDIRFDKVIRQFIYNAYSDIQSNLKDAANGLDSTKVKSAMVLADWLVLFKYVPFKMFLNLRFII